MEYGYIVVIEGGGNFWCKVVYYVCLYELLLN